MNDTEPVGCDCWAAPGSVKRQICREKGIVFLDDQRDTAECLTSKGALTQRPRRVRRYGKGTLPWCSDEEGQAEEGASMQATSTEIVVNTRSAPEFVDITPLAQMQVMAAGVMTGIAALFCRHTTAALMVNEADPGLHRDIAAMLERLAPRGGHYDHNGPNGEDNGHAHCRQALLGGSVSLPIVEGKLALGQWQRIYLVELDAPRQRRVLVQVFGV
ncbi:MAG: secondary thiamine-phosphate synthase enzyme YjbQ [Chloroflexi bacterium]|nr:secondary thiamine-phosphate synthase enzyme YjbQ [Chloroflexota bacterium]